ncbi:hypothetical protein [Arthrobacter sp. CAN_C5]|uniref:hypothetical protein n=1 Tax=Arthrobacter sp. CAN_C5 TaxID=2760706 RepID=UPI0037C1B432
MLVCLTTPDPFAVQALFMAGCDLEVLSAPVLELIHEDRGLGNTEPETDHGFVLST